MTHRTEPTHNAWAGGLISAEQAVVIGSAVNKLGADVATESVQTVQADLVDHAQTLTHTQLQVLANHLVEVVDPDGADQQPTDTNASPSPTATKGASSRAATAHQPGPKPTTSPAGQTADPPTWPTAACSAATTTTWSTKASGQW